MRRLALVASVLLCGCATTTTQEPDGDPDGPPPDLLPKASGDALPSGAIALFKTPLCPTGWLPYGPAAGRVLLPTVGTAGLTAARGEALRSGEDRKHTHAVVAKLSLRSVQYVGIAGEANHGVASAAATSYGTTADPASLGLPYLQLLACQKTAPPRPSQGQAKLPVPRGTLIYMADAKCPDGYAQAGATQGRFLVGLPMGGKRDHAFGGPPIEGAEQRTHSHTTTGKLSLPSHGIALASGCCATGYAAAGDYDLSGAAEKRETDLPSLSLLQCQKL